MALAVQSRLRLGLTLAVLFGQVVALRATEPRPVAARDPWVPELGIEKYQLPNGLTVILHEDHKAPLVAVNIVYNVGGKDDPPGRTGFAHLFEHMMFKGSQHSDGSYFWPIYPYFASTQGTTECDRTIYRTTVTRNALELVLWLEADRMGFLLPVLTDKKLANVRNVVKMERRETVDDQPLGEVEETLIRVLYPPGHPYRHLNIGSHEDVSAAQLQDVSAFFRKHYAPNNAFLCLAGDFKPALARRWIKKYFGALSPCVLAAPPKADEKSSIQPCQITLTDRVSHSRVMLVWKTVPAYHPDEPAIDVLASVLGGQSKANRLFRALIDDRRIATQVGASHPTHLLAGRFELTLVAPDGQKLDELVRLADAEIERLKREGPTADEVRRAKLERRTFQMQQLESVTSKAGVLNHYAATLGEPLAYRSELIKIFAVTPADVARVARQYLGTARIELHILRGERVVRQYERELDSRALDHDLSVRRVPRREVFDRSVVPESAPTPRFVLPVIKTLRLSSGLEVRIIERHELPRVTLKLVVKSGETSVPCGKEGLCSIAVDLLKEGTKTRSTLQLDNDLLEAGATLSTSGSLESSIVTLTTATRRLEEALDLYSDVILNPSFPDRDLQRLKLDRLDLLEERSHSPEKIAQDVFPRLLFHPRHPYARAQLGTLESVRSITRQDVIEFYIRNFVPARAALIVVGDVQADAIVAALEARFGKWARGPIPPPLDLRLMHSPADSPTIYLIDKPGAEQSLLSVGWLGTGVTERARYSLGILKMELAIRLERTLREDVGSSYGFLSSFPRRNGAAPLVITGAVHKLDTKEALLEVFKVMNDLAGPNPVTEEEIQTIYNGMVPTWLDSFETNTDVATEVADMLSHGLPDRQWATELYRYAVVTENDASQAARKYITPSGIAILLVGDRAWVEALLGTVPFVKTIILLDSHGNLLPNPPARQNRHRPDSPAG